MELFISNQVLQRPILKCEGPIRDKQDQLEPLYSINSILDFLRPKPRAKMDSTGPDRTKQEKSGLCGTKLDHEQPYWMIWSHMVPYGQIVLISTIWDQSGPIGRIGTILDHGRPYIPPLNGLVLSLNQPCVPEFQFV